MSSLLDKLVTARQLLLEVEEELIQQRKFCPYEVGNALNKIDEAINQFKED